MASERITKTNIDKQEKKIVAALANAKGISATKMLSDIIQFYLENNK